MIIKPVIKIWPSGVENEYSYKLEFGDKKEIFLGKIRMEIGDIRYSKEGISDILEAAEVYFENKEIQFFYNDVEINKRDLVNKAKFEKSAKEILLIRDLNKKIDKVSKNNEFFKLEELMDDEGDGWFLYIDWLDTFNDYEIPKEINRTNLKDYLFINIGFWGDRLSLLHIKDEKEKNKWQDFIDENQKSDGLMYNSCYEDYLDAKGDGIYFNITIIPDPEARFQTKNESIQLGGFPHKDVNFIDDGSAEKARKKDIIKVLGLTREDKGFILIETMFCSEIYVESIIGLNNENKELLSQGRLLFHNSYFTLNSMKFDYNDYVRDYQENNFSLELVSISSLFES